MSFILDALRKSETERQREVAPSFSQVPIAVARPRVPPWAWLVIGALTLCVAVLGGAWWQTAQTRSVATPEQRAVDAAPSAPERFATDARPNVGSTAVPGDESPDVSALLPQPSAESVRTLPTVAEMQAAGMALPPLDLQLLAYSEDSAERFVFINGFQYRQGQTVQNGPQIVTIYSEGVVLRQQGREFVLLPN